jgi:GSH-dependent disulfide-bond oxidoreductase
MAQLQLYTLATPNGQKVSVALEEMGLDYQAHTVNILMGEQFEDQFIKINPNSKIPALVDLEGDQGQPLNIMESGAILLYLAEKTGQFIPKDIPSRSRCLQWLFFQMGGIGPMFGQFGHFYRYAKDKCDHPYPLKRYSTEAQRLLGVLEKQLENNQFIAGPEYTIADMAIAPWVHCLSHFYKADEILGLEKFENVNEWLQNFMSRPAVQTGMEVGQWET